ncbi:MAG: hypothetical protein QXL31_05805 [Thermosphaera sp.]
MRPSSVYEEWVATEELDKVEVPPERVYTRRGAEEDEAIRVAIERDYVDFFETSPIIVSRSRESGRIFLADGWIRYRIARLGGAKKIKIRVREFETDKEAYEDALVISHNLNASRGNVVGYSILNMVRYLKDAGMSAREIAERLNRSETYVYNLLAVLRNQELVEKVRNEEISLREAIGLAYKRTPDYDRHSVGGEAVSGDISAKEARIEVAKPGKAKVEEARGKEAKIEEIPGTIRAEVDRAFRKLENMALIGEEDKLKLLRRAYEALKGEPSEIQREAIRLWARRCAEDRALYDDFTAFIEEAKIIAEERGAAGAKPSAKHAKPPEKGQRSWRDVLREVEAALNAFNLSERDRRALLKDAEKIFGGEDPEIAIKAVRIWRGEGGALGFREALEKAKRGEVLEEVVEEVRGINKCPRCGRPLTCSHCGWPGRGAT